jgi:hypothetical protein
MLPTRTRPGWGQRPCGQCSGGKTIHAPVVEWTSLRRACVEGKAFIEGDDLI